MARTSQLENIVLYFKIKHISQRSIYLTKNMNNGFSGYDMISKVIIMKNVKTEGTF